MLDRHTYLTLLLSTLLLTACGKGSTALPYEKDASFKQMGEKGEQALKVVEAECKPLVVAASSIPSVSVSGGLAHGITPDFGWNKAITLEFQVPEKLPSDFPVPSAAGHRCWIEAGGGLKPGIRIIKSSCTDFCALPHDSHLKDVPALVALESRADAEAIEQKRQEPGKAKLQALDAAARKGDYQSRRNLAYGYATGDGGSPYDLVKACAWYKVIVDSNSPKVDITDYNNAKLYCGFLQPGQKPQADALQYQLEGNPARTPDGKYPIIGNNNAEIRLYDRKIGHARRFNTKLEQIAPQLAEIERQGAMLDYAERKRLDTFFNQLKEEAESLDDLPFGPLNQCRSAGIVMGQYWQAVRNHEDSNPSKMRYQESARDCKMQIQTRPKPTINLLAMDGTPPYANCLRVLSPQEDRSKPVLWSCDKR